MSTGSPARIQAALAAIAVIGVLTSCLPVAPPTSVSKGTTVRPAPHRTVPPALPTSTPHPGPKTPSLSPTAAPTTGPRPTVPPAGSPSPSPTPSLSPVPSPSVSSPPLSPWFSRSSFWNAPLLADAPVVTGEAPALARQARYSQTSTPVAGYYGNGGYNPIITESAYSVPVYTVPADQPTVRVAG